MFLASLLFVWSLGLELGCLDTQNVVDVRRISLNVLFICVESLDFICKYIITLINNDNSQIYK